MPIACEIRMPALKSWGNRPRRAVAAVILACMAVPFAAIPVAAVEPSHEAAMANMLFQGEGRARDPVAQLNLGDMHVTGDGVKRDLAEAYFWLGLAAAQGNDWARRRQRAIRDSLSVGQREAVDERLASSTAVRPLTDAALIRRSRS